MYKKLITGMTIISIVLGGWLFVDDRFAHAADMRKQSQIIELIQLSVANIKDQMTYDSYQSMIEYRQRKLWKWEDKYGKDLEKAPQDVKDSYHELVLEIGRIELKLRLIEDKRVKREATKVLSEETNH